MTHQCRAKVRCNNPGFCKDQTVAGRCKKDLDINQAKTCGYQWIKGVDGYRNKPGANIQAPYTPRGRKNRIMPIDASPPWFIVEEAIVVEGR